MFKNLITFIFKTYMLNLCYFIFIVFFSLVLTTFSNILIFHRLSLACRKGSHFLASFISSYFHRLIFRHISNHFIFSTWTFWLASCLGGDSTYSSFYSQTRIPPDIHLLSLNYLVCFRISFMFKWRLQFFHFLQEFLLRSSLLGDLLIILEHGSIS